MGCGWIYPKDVVVDLQSTVFGCDAVVVDGTDDQLPFSRQAHTEA